jgi:hypothetical protein
MRNAMVEKISCVSDKNKGYGIQVRKKGNALHNSTAEPVGFRPMLANGLSFQWVQLIFRQNYFL